MEEFHTIYGRHNMYQVIVVRSDLGMRCGKRVAQGAHASVKAVKELLDSKMGYQKYLKWDEEGHKKVVCRVTGEKELRDIHARALRWGFPCAIIWDQALTQLKEEAYTAVAVGPADDEEMKKLTGRLKLMS